MIGIIVQLLLSALLLRFIERKGLSVLGLSPTRNRLQLAALFFTLTAAISASDYLLKMLIAQQRWVLARPVQLPVIAEGIWWNIKSVLFEELLFRGALLYIVLRRTGTLPAVLVSAAAFGIYHWFSFEVIGNPVAMLYTFIVTGLMGVVYAYGYVRTMTLYTPIAIHFGWNVVRSVVFSDTSIGRQLFVEVKPAPIVHVGYLQYAVLVFAALTLAIVVNFWLIRRLPQRAIA
jgi:membrane protease YdiL (CAAX protease family)